MTDKKYLTICIPKSGKPYLRQSCAPSDKVLDNVEIDASYFTKIMDKLDRLDKEVRLLRATTKRTRKEPPRPYPKNTPYFFGPDGNKHEITEDEWGALEKQRVFGDEPKPKKKIESFIGPDGKRYNI